MVKKEFFFRDKPLDVDNDPLQELGSCDQRQEEGRANHFLLEWKTISKKFIFLTTNCFCHTNPTLYLLEL